MHATYVHTKATKSREFVLCSTGARIFIRKLAARRYVDRAGRRQTVALGIRQAGALRRTPRVRCRGGREHVLAWRARGKVARAGPGGRGVSASRRDRGARRVASQENTA